MEDYITMKLSALLVDINLLSAISIGRVSKTSELL